MEEKRINVTSPLLPELFEFEKCLEDIWDSKILTNNGKYHKLFEKALSEYLGVPYISVFTNGTLPLITGLQALDIHKGEVITTPYSFVATSHSIWWNGLSPVFVDIEPEYGNINPDKIESAITENTVAIMPVHVYGNPCNTDKIKKIADKYNLKVIYDAAHAFGVKKNGKSILLEGDISTLSFHATKVFNTIEGGALICHSAEMKNKIDQLKNFGFTSEVSVELPGINSKMDEVRSAFGLLNLRKIDDAIASRKRTVELYRSHLQNIDGITFMNDIEGVKHNYSYFPIFINEKIFGKSRDIIYNEMKNSNIFTRRYFYPLITQFDPYKKYDSAKDSNLLVANRIANEILCLPLYAYMKNEEITRVLSFFKK